MSIKNLKIRFNLNKENDRKAYEYLQNAEVSYSRAVISAICGYMELSETKAGEDAFLEKIVMTIKEEVSKSDPLGGLLQFAHQPVAQTPPAKKENTAETEETMLDFLDSF